MADTLCRRCLLEDMHDEQALYAVIQERICLMANEERAEPAQYRQRLAICRACDQLQSGTCAQCGCYVEIRAARRAMQCAHITPKWGVEDYQQK